MASLVFSKLRNNFQKLNFEQIRSLVNLTMSANNEFKGLDGSMPCLNHK